MLRCDIRGGINDVLAELVVRKGATQQGRVIELDVRDEGNNRVGAATGGGGGDGNRAFVSGEALAIDFHPGQFARACGGGAGCRGVRLGRGRLVGGGIFDLGVLCQVAIVGPARAAANNGERAEAASDKDTAGELLLGELLFYCGLLCGGLFCRGLGGLVAVLSHVLFVIHDSRLPVYSQRQA